MGLPTSAGSSNRCDTLAGSPGEGQDPSLDVSLMPLLGLLTLPQQLLADIPLVDVARREPLVLLLGVHPRSPIGPGDTLELRCRLGVVRMRPRAPEAPGGAGLHPQALNWAGGTTHTRTELGGWGVHLDGPPPVAFLFVKPLERVDRCEGILLECIAQLVYPAHLDGVEQHAAHYFRRRRGGLSAHRRGGPCAGEVSDERGSGRGSDDGVKVAKYLFVPLPAKRLGVEEHISHNCKGAVLISLLYSSEGNERPHTFRRLGLIHIPN
jgi:hypothetical protein